MSRVKVYGLLFISEGESCSPNLRARGFNEQIKLYMSNAATLSRSLAIRDIAFTLLTNRPEIAKSFNHEINTVQIPFYSAVPTGIRFYQAHHKIDVFDYLSKLQSQYSIFCDLDVVCINDMPESLSNIISRNIPVVYNISDQVIPAYGIKQIISDLELVKGSLSVGTWYGGEFIGGTASFFKKLSIKTRFFWEQYVNSIHKVNHIGDELITTVSLESLKEDGVYIIDGGSLGIISRFWTTRILHPQRTYMWSASCFLLHLPGSKEYLAGASLWNDKDLHEFKTLFGNALFARYFYYSRMAYRFNSARLRLARMFLKFFHWL